jgi:uncharacterized RDD family membrane protein YckC
MAFIRQNREVMRDRAAPALLRRRGAAALVDSVPVVIVVGTVAWAKLRRQPDYKPRRKATIVAQGVFLLGTSWLVAARGTTPGQRLLGLRVVDAATGKNLPFRRALLRNVVRSGGSLLRLAIGRRWLENPRGRRKLVYDRLTALQPKISELQDQYAGDPKGLSDALSTLYREYNANPLKACLDPQLIISILYSAALYVPAVSTSHHQALHDRLAHAAVIRTK